MEEAQQLYSECRLDTTRDGGFWLGALRRVGQIRILIKAVLKNLIITFSFLLVVFYCNLTNPGIHPPVCSNGRMVPLWTLPSMMPIVIIIGYLYWMVFCIRSRTRVFTGLYASIKTNNDNPSKLEVLDNFCLFHIPYFYSRIRSSCLF